jgi:hypothetical protein
MNLTILTDILYNNNFTKVIIVYTVISMSSYDGGAVTTCINGSDLWRSRSNHCF